MSLLHRSLLARIMAGMEPVVEGAVAALVPGGAALVPLIKAGETALEGVADSVSGTAASGPVTAAAPAAPVPAAPTAPAAPAPGSAQELALALAAVLQKYLPQ